MVRRAAGNGSQQARDEVDARAYEAEIRWQVLGEKLRILRQMELALPVSNQYAYEQRG